MSVDIFLQETPYIDFSSPIVRDQSKALFKSVNSELEKVRIAFEFVVTRFRTPLTSAPLSSPPELQTS